MTSAPSGNGIGAYRGDDRRLQALAQGPVLRRPLVLGAGLILAGWAVTLLLPAGAGQDQLAPVLATAAAALGVVVGTLCLARWLVAGEAPALLLGGASLCYGAVVVGVGELGPLLTGSGAAAAAGWLRPAAIVVVLALLTAALGAREVDTRLDAGSVLGGALAALVGLALLLPLAPGLAVIVDGAGPLPPRTWEGGGGPSLLLAGSTVLAGTYGLRGWRRGHWLDASFALLLLTIALGEVARLLAGAGLGEAHPGTAGREVVRLVGLAAALRGALGQLLVGYRDVSQHLHTARVSLASAQDRIRAHRQHAEEQAHEARSALAAIEGATRTLEHYRDRLPATTREQLTSAVRGEIARLQRLVSPEPEPVVAFGVADLLAPLVTAERARAVKVTVEVETALRAWGRPEATADALRTLFDNARRYAPGSPVSVRAGLVDGRVVLRVEDRGPGVLPEERGAVFARGVRGHAGREVGGSGLGLYLAAEVLRESDGVLWVDDRPGGGASFAVALPAVPTAATQIDAAARRTPSEQGVRQG